MSPATGQPAGNLLASRAGRRVLFASLYVSEGAPMGFIWWALPTLLSREGVDLATITLITSTATLPWVFKFLAGPVVDASTRRRGGLRRWIIVCQVLMGLTLLPLAGFGWGQHTDWLLGLLLAHAVAAAAQDVAIDTLAMRAVPVLELGPINGWMQAGMLLGRAGVAASALILYSELGKGVLVAGLVAAVWLPMLLLVWRTREPVAPSHDPPGRGAGGWLRALLVLPMLLGLWIALTAGAGFEFLGVAAGPLLVELGADSATTALFFALVAPTGLGVGALLGGWCCRQFGARRMTALSIGLMAALATALGTALSHASLEPSAWLLAFGTAYATAGALTASSYAFFMQLARGRHAATRYSALMAGTNACEAWAAAAGGRLHGTLGYGASLMALAGASLLALPALLVVSRAGDAGTREGGRQTG